MDDLISRQAAIDAIRWEIEINGYGHIIDVLRYLPSAQPEIVRCKDCKWCRDADGLMCKNPASWVVATDCDFGCVLAERRTDEEFKPGRGNRNLERYED